jgi:hypothetical protein
MINKYWSIYSLSHETHAEVRKLYQKTHILQGFHEFMHKFRYPAGNHLRFFFRGLSEAPEGSRVPQEEKAEVVSGYGNLLFVVI